MSIWSKVLVGFIFVASVAFFYFATRTLASHRAWQEAARSYDLPLEKAQKEIAQLQEGNSAATPPVLSISQLDVKLHDLLVGRGKVWRGCAVKTFDQNTLQLVVEVPFPDPHQIQDKMVLYLFEESEPGHYMGEYKVAGIAEKAVELAPTMKPPTPALLKLQQDRVRGTKVPWSIYEKLPTDQHEVFRGYDQAQLAQMMPGVPPETLQEFLRDGSDAQKGVDPDDRVFDGKYERLLRDYEVYFHEIHGQLASVRDQIAAAKTDKAIADKLQADTEKEVAARQSLIDMTLKPDLAEVQGELAIVTTHRDALAEKLDGKKDESGKSLTKGVHQQIEEALAENKRLLAQWTSLQVGAAKRLDELIDRETTGPATSYTGE
jgi:hypothetical protein